MQDAGDLHVGLQSRFTHVQHILQELALYHVNKCADVSNHRKRPEMHQLEAIVLLEAVPLQRHRSLQLPKGGVSLHI
jgi:hypothetical protein